MLISGETVCYIIAVLVATIGLIYLYIQKCSYNYWKKLGVPHFTPEFPYGNCVDSLTLKKPLGESLITMYGSMKAQGHFHMGFYFFHKPFYVPISPDMIRNVMAKDFQYFHDRGFYHHEEADPLSAHLFSLNGLKWKNLRAKLTPTFTSGKLKKMFETLVDCSSELKECLNEPIRTSEPIDIKHVLVQYTTDVIGSCAFGIECNSFKNPNTEFFQLADKIFNPVGFQRAKLFFAFLFPSLAGFFRVRLTNIDVDRFYRNLVKDTIEYREKNNITRNDFMQLLMQLKNKGSVEDDEQTKDKQQTENEIGTKLSMNEVAAQAFLFFIAGFETSSTAMTFTLLELSQNQDIQDKLREEIVRVLKQHDGQITYNAISEMRYMDRVVQEAMRKHPPLMFLQRIVTKNYKIPDTDITLEKDTIVLVPTLAIHTDPEYYSDPERFDPDRFTEENIKSRPDYTYLPFGEGPRICIGLRFGMMQIKVGLCQLIKNCNFTLNPKTELPLELDPTAFVRTTKHGVWLNAEKIV